MERLIVIKTDRDELFDDELAQKIEASACVGDPIDTATGSQLLEHTLLTVQGVLPIHFTLNYNSLLLKPGILGNGWGDKNFSAHLEELPNGEVKIHWTTNRYNMFPKTPTGDYQPIHRNCQFDRLVKNLDGSFTLTRQHQLYHFNAQGQLIATGRPNGQQLTLTYNAQDQLVKITEPISGVFLEYTYNT